MKNIKELALMMLNLYGVPEKTITDSPEALNVFVNEVESQDFELRDDLNQRRLYAEQLLAENKRLFDILANNDQYKQGRRDGYQCCKDAKEIGNL